MGQLNYRVFIVILSISLIFCMFYLNNNAAATPYYYTGLSAGNSYPVNTPFNAMGITNDPTVASVEILWVSLVPHMHLYFDDTISTATTVTNGGQTEYHFISPIHAPSIVGDWGLTFYFKDAAGTVVGQNNFLIHELPTPDYQITFYTNPTGLGSITFNSITYTNGQTSRYPVGQYPLSANAPEGWKFDHWETTGLVEIFNSVAFVTGQCTIKAVFSVTPQNMVPETPLGPLIASATMLVALAAFVILKIMRINIPSHTK